MTTSITVNTSIGSKAKAAPASPAAPQSPPGIGMASSSASSKKSLGFVRRATSGGENNGGAIGPPSALSLSPGCYSFRDALLGGSSGGGSADAGSSHTATTSSSVDSSAWSGGGHNPEGGGNFDLIFRTSSRQQHEESAGDVGVVEEEEATQSRNESSREGRLRSLRSQFGSNESLGDSLMLLLQQGGGRSGVGGVGGGGADSPRDLQALAPDDDSLDERTSSRRDGTPGRVPHSSSPPFADGPIDVFRRRGYSPIIGTPTRAGGAARKDLLDWGRSRANGDEGLLPGEGTSSSWGIRPSLSCPTSVFESPLFPPSSPSSPQISSRSGGGGGRRPLSLCAHSFGGYNSHSDLLGGGAGGGRAAVDGASALMLSRPYRLEKIQSASAEPSPSHGSDGDGTAAAREGGFLGGTMLLGGDGGGGLSSDEDDGPAGDGGDVDGGDRLESMDVSAIECDEDSPFRDGPTTDRVGGSPRRSPGAATGGGGAAADPGGDPRRKLSDAFDLVVVDGGASPQADGGDSTASSTKTSPTSVSAFDGGEAASGDTLSSGSASRGGPGSSSSTLQLENGLAVASISMPHFHLHDALRGTLSQGLIDRVSFYSVVRDINKEALDAAMTDPRGSVYNDGTVHGNASARGADGDASKPSAGSLPLSHVDGRHQVIAEDGKIHVHPNPKEERNSVLVMACLSEEKNPNEPSHADDLPESECSAAGNPSKTSSPSLGAASPSLGAALLDEEWWLMSAIASRTPDEVLINQSSKLLPTFHEAIGEKDCVAPETTAGGTSRTQLWKPGRSWWEAKSGKNPWVEPVVHNNRWRLVLARPAFPISPFIHFANDLAALVVFFIR